MRKYDRTGRHVHTESSLGASIDYSHDKDGNLSEMNSGGWSARWQRDRVGLETERELTGGVHVKTHHDSLGRETYKSVGARNVEQFRRSYTWGIGNRLHATEDGLTGRRVRYDYDEFDNLLSAEYKQGNDVERIYRIPDRIGNLFETREKDDRKYGAGSRLAEDRDYFYHYDCEGNLVFKEFRTLDWAGVSVPLGGQKAHLEEELGITFRAFGAGWRYDWQSDGMLSRVVRPDGKEVSFTYDALGRRTEKTYEGITTHFVWDGNVPLHEWQEISSDTEKADIITWLFEQDTFIPAAKLAANGESFSIVSDYLGTPLQAFDNNGNKVWEQELDIFDRKKRKNSNNSSFIPFKYQGQYEDVETGLYYNRFRYYDSCTGNYISQDPIRLNSRMYNFYSYVSNTNHTIDIFGLDWNYVLVNSKEETYYHGRASEQQKLQDVARRHAGTQGKDGVRFGEGDTLKRKTPINTDYDIVRGIEQRGISENKLLGRRNENVRGNKINGISEARQKTIIGKKRLANADNYLSGKKPSELPTLDELNYDDFKGHH
ncbi:hypothetical protein HMPREF0666_02768 [Prevotella sp. C561]|uniref:RHS repeat domain-containing protein n=1 Tax=Prevotella sp. C561 TaxID=563031 RepID=UPI0002237988|nr:RHS repeat-associated core domain-containing protein [Prevotella sp. C561]EGW49403.1 hypothetical protein HMPREF0666_02768 [Prevotella sp. C561]